MTFDWPTALLGLLAIPLLAGVYVPRPVDDAATPSASPTPRSCRTSSPRPRGGGAGCRRPSRWRRSPCSWSGSRGTARRA